MPLEPVAAEPGLWINPDCSPTGPGLHALIIGVSRYDHLGEGSAPAPDTYGLSQLSVSALTAYRFFSWLRDDYVLDGWPVARVRLLMSPLRKGVGGIETDEIEGCDAEICAHAPEATFDNCKRALENWYVDMESLQAPATGRSLFLFSGHGMERRQSYQLLLPSDYLRPPSRPLNEAISTPNIADALSYLTHVSSHVLLLDGCRNDIDKLRGASGTKILNDEQPISVNPRFEKGALYATASGLRAYSPRRGGLSLFGQALLDGLTNDPNPKLDESPIELIRKGGVSIVEINKLGSYVKGRVAALIDAANESVVQVVRSEVASSDPGKPIDLAELPVALSDSLPQHTLGFSLETTRRMPVRLAKAAPSRAPDAWFQERYQAVRKAVAVAPDASRQDHIKRLQAIFGSEAVADAWFNNLKIIGLSTDRILDHNAVEIISSAQAARRSQLHRVQLNFRIKNDDPVGHLITIKSERGRRFCSILPNDICKPIFQLEIDVEHDEYINFGTYLSPQNEGTTGQIAVAWEQLRACDPLAAVRRLEADHMAGLEQAFREGEKVLRLKLHAPLAAAVATILLLKGNQFKRMHEWARNLANWFPTIPDGVVLWTEQRRRMVFPESLGPKEMGWFVRELSCRSLPFTSEAFGLAADLLSDIERGRLRSYNTTRQAALALADRLNAAAIYFREDGLFCTYAGFPEDWNPRLILGTPPAPRIHRRLSRQC
jgi:hypothetical protein